MPLGFQRDPPYAAATLAFLAVVVGISSVRTYFRNRRRREREGQAREEAKGKTKGV